MGLLKWLEGYGVNIAIVLTVVGFLMAFLVVVLLNIPTARWLGFGFAITPIFLPYFLFKIFFHEWMEYVQLAYDLKQGRVTIEILFPQEVFKSPLAMELVFNQMYQTASPDNLVETYWDGKHPPVFGLEIVSDEGRVHFYISTPLKKYKNMWEAHLYAQYPGIIIRQLETDYTAAVPWDPENIECFAIHYQLARPDPYPLKTYIDYGLDKDPKEEFKIDPVTPMLEVLGSIGPREKIWAQILISAHRKQNFKLGSLHAHPDWQGDIAATINKLAQRDTDKKGAAEFESAPRVTPGERELIAAMERHAGKYAFNTRIRTINIGIGEGRALLGERIGPVITMWRPFQDITRNGISFSWRTDFDYNWWQDPSGKKRRELKRSELLHYKKRSYLRRDAGDGGFILTTEELATIFHPAGKVILTPSLERIQSARSEAPANLPLAPSSHHG